MGPFQQALDHSLKTYFINGLYVEPIYKVDLGAESPALSCPFQIRSHFDIRQGPDLWPQDEW
jgi:hypothetical protein